MTNELNGIDPLALRFDDDVMQSDAHRRLVNGILSSYASYFDVFSELVQNSLDAIDSRWKENVFVNPTISITIDDSAKSIRVTDNGCGMEEEAFRHFLSPHHSFNKSQGVTRGYKGVGATYLAYGFGALAVHTKSSDGYEAAYKLENGRVWAQDKTGVASKPMITSIDEFDSQVTNSTSGTSIEIKFNGAEGEKPSDLTYYCSTAEQWKNILKIKTPLGSIQFEKPEFDIQIDLSVISKSGDVSKISSSGLEYFWPADNIPNVKSESLGDVASAFNDQKDVPPELRWHSMPEKFKDLDIIWEIWGPEELLDPNGPFSALFGGNEQFRDIVNDHKVTVRADWLHSARLWGQLNDDILGFRSGSRIIRGGLQMANDGMPNGELLEIPLTSQIGYQRNCHVVVHFNEGNPDQGRKVFQPELRTLAEQIAARCVRAIQT